MDNLSTFFALELPTPTMRSKGRGNLPPFFWLEKKSGRKVVSRENYLDAPESTRRLSRSKDA